MRTNNIRVWSQRAYEEEIVVRRFFGRSSVLFNAPEAIRHVLVDHPEAYGRTRATLRILKPLLGEGLFTSEGSTWRYQRWTLAPALTPRSVELLILHIRSATTEMIGSLATTEKERVDLLPMIQRVTLEMGGTARAPGQDHALPPGAWTTAPAGLPILQKREPWPG